MRIYSSTAGPKYSPVPSRWRSTWRTSPPALVYVVCLPRKKKLKSRLSLLLLLLVLGVYIYSVTSLAGTLSSPWSLPARPQQQMMWRVGLRMHRDLRLMSASESWMAWGSSSSGWPGSPLPGAWIDAPEKGWGSIGMTWQREVKKGGERVGDGIYERLCRSESLGNTVHSVARWPGRLFKSLFWRRTLDRVASRYEGDSRTSSKMCLSCPPRALLVAQHN